MDSLPAIIKAAELCDHYGIDTISTGGCIAWAMECFEKGLLTKDATDGVELTFGNSTGLIEVIKKIGCRSGIGDLLADGVRLASSRLGGGSASWAMHAKGLEFPGYDPRAMKTLALGYTVGLRGACHNRAPGYEIDMSGEVDRFKGEAGRGSKLKDQEDFAAVLDSLIICKFIRKCFDDFYGEVAYLYSQATGLDLTPSELKNTGERINNIKKCFNIREGWQASDDWLPPRLFKDPITDGVGKGTVITEEELKLMIVDYYQNRGWTAEGLITEDKLRALELEDSIAPVEGLQYGKKIYNL